MYNFVHSLNNATCIYPRFSKLLCIYIYLVGSVPTPLKNMISSVGVIIPKYMESQKNHVPNHQPDDDGYYPIILMIIIPLHGSYGLCIYIYITIM